MATNARRFSQIKDDMSEASIAGVFAKSRCRSSTGSTQDRTREPKRRRTSGINARFDNMIYSMEATYPGSQSLRQTRTRSSSDASHLSSAIADAYSDLHEGRIGENFTLVKMQPLADSFAGSMQTTISSERSQNHSGNTSAVCKDLPEWLRSTFSSLSEKHPLRLLLPKESHCPQNDANDHIPDDFKIDSTFAFGLDHTAQTRPNHLQAGNFIGSTDNHSFCFDPRSPTSLGVYSADSKANVQQTRSLSAACGDHVPLTLNDVSFSTFIPNNVSVRQLPMPFKMNEVNERDPNLASDFKGLAFTPFSTPGPASTLGSYVSTNSLPPIVDSHAAYCLVDTDTETSACFPRHPTTFPISHSRHTSTESSAIDSCLPPYCAVTSDPAPAYSSDGIYDGAYYAHPSRDESDSEPRGLSLRTDGNFASVFATPGLGHCAPRPIFPESLTQAQSDLDDLIPGCEIDLDVIDFKWTPFNRKLVEEKKLVPGDECRSESRNNLDPEYSELGTSCIVKSRAVSPKVTPLPDSLPSPSPFRFTPPRLTTNTNSTFNHVEPRTTQTIKLDQPFAPAPGIYVSPLRDKVQAQTSVLKTPQNQIISTESWKAELNVETEFPSSQGSFDSIQSWQDADEDCP